MVLGKIFPKETIVVNLESTEKDELFEELVEVVHRYYPSMDRSEALDALNDRESKMTTGIMHSVAVPHALIPSMRNTKDLGLADFPSGGCVGAIGISKDGIDYDSLDKAPVHVVFMIIGADGETEKHIQILKQLATVLQLPNFVDKILKCESASEVYNFIVSSEDALED